MSETKTIELLEIFKEMPATTFRSEFRALNKTLEAQMEAFKDLIETQMKIQNTKYNVLIWVIGGATVVLSTVITLLSVMGN